MINNNKGFLRRSETSSKMAMFQALPSKGWVSLAYSSIISFYFKLIIFIVSMVTLPLPLHNHAYPSMLFPLILQILPPWLHSLYAQLHFSFISLFFYILTSPRMASIYLYQASLIHVTLILIYTIYHIWSIFTCFKACCLWKPLPLARWSYATCWEWRILIVQGQKG